METSEQECVRALLDTAERLGESPTKGQYDSLGVTPASATIQRVMGVWNEAKEAAGLATNSSTGSRTQPKPDDVTLPDDVDWESLSVHQRWHYENREWNTERSLRRRASLRRWLAEHKREHGGCRRCDETDLRCLQFHHVDAKRATVSRLVSNGAPESAVREEVERCVVYCANCHHREHRERRDRPVESDRI